MTNRIFTALTALLILLSVLFLVRAGLTNGSPEGVDDLAGPLVFWHSWDDARAAALDQIVDRYEEENPGVRVVTVKLTDAELLARYTAAARNGFGPDLFLGPGEWAVDLLADELVRPVSSESQTAIIGFFSPNTLSTVRARDNLYGLPFGLRTTALYYNRAMVQRPASTLDELLAQAGEGSGVGLGTSFETALWGLGASGGQLYDDSGQVIVDGERLSSWLTWLRNAQDNQSFVMSTNQEGLRELFREGGLAYLVDTSDILPLLSAEMPAEELGVARLPSGPGGEPTPLLRSEVLFFSPVSSARQQKLAEDIALYLVSREQQTLLMRRSGLIPAHRTVRINSRLNPAIATFVAQSRSATPWTVAPLLAWLLHAGDEMYIQALDGILSPKEAAADLQQRLQSAFSQP